MLPTAWPEHARPNWAIINWPKELQIIKIPSDLWPTGQINWLFQAFALK
jgi:hypothetical protein